MEGEREGERGIWRRGREGLEGGEGKGKGSVGRKALPWTKIFHYTTSSGDTVLEGSKHTLVLAVPEFLYIVYSVG